MLFKDPFPPMFISRARKFISNESSDLTELCKRLLPYRAEVTFRLATDTVSVTVRTRRLSFFDKLSAFGNLKHQPTLSSLKYLLYCQVVSSASSLGSVFSAWSRSLSGWSGSVSEEHNRIIHIFLVWMLFHICV